MKISMYLLRQLLNQYDKEEISISKFLEELNKVAIPITPKTDDLVPGVRDEEITKDFALELAFRLQDPLSKVDFTNLAQLSKRIRKIISVIKFRVVREEDSLASDNESTK
jgi:hypothetical protein